MRKRRVLAVPVLTALLFLLPATASSGKRARKSRSSSRKARKGRKARPSSRPPGPGRLSGSKKARYIKLYRKGNILLYQAHYVPAVAHFKAAIKLAPHVPGAWRQLGLAREGLREYKAAIKAYEKYLELAGTGGRYAIKVMRRINVCRGKLGLPPKRFKELFTGKPGKLAISCNVDGALIQVDNVTRGSTPTAPLPVNPGLRTIMLSKTGYLPWSKTMSVEANRTISLKVTLKNDPNYRPVVIRPVPRGPTVTPNMAFLTVAANTSAYTLRANGKAVPRSKEGPHRLKPGSYNLEVSAPGRTRWKGRVQLIRGQKKTITVQLYDLKRKKTFRRWAWITLGTAAALATAGAALGILENYTFEKVRDRAAPDRDKLDAMAKKGKMYGTVSYSLLGAAGAAFVTSAVLFFFARRGEVHRDAKPKLVLGPAGKGAGIAVTYTGKVDF